MTATVRSLSTRRQALGLPPARPVPRQIRKGDRARVPNLGFSVGYVQDGYMNAARAEMTYAVMVGGVVHALEARDVVPGDGPSPGRRDAH